MNMLGSIVLMGGLGVAIGAVLVVASKAFYVYEDPKVVAITEAFPGANCGGCGQPGCSANAEAVVKGEADVNSCVAAGDDVAMAGGKGQLIIIDCYNVFHRFTLLDVNV